MGDRQGGEAAGRVASEEVVGQIQDEFDQEKPLLVKTSEQTWEMDGSLPLHELENIVGERLLAEGITTVSGWITFKSGGFPRQGQTLALEHFNLRVLETDGPRVAKVILERRLETSSNSP